MPARRFFALMRSKRKLECIHAIERLDEALVASDNVNMKWYESLREQRVESLRAMTMKEITEAPKVEYTDEEIRETQATVLNLFRQRKRYMGYGG